MRQAGAGRPPPSGAQTPPTAPGMLEHAGSIRCRVHAWTQKTYQREGLSTRKSRLKRKEIRCGNCDRLLAVIRGEGIEIKCRCQEYTLITERRQRQSEGHEPPARKSYGLTSETVPPPDA